MQPSPLYSLKPGLLGACNFYVTTPGLSNAGKKTYRVKDSISESYNTDKILNAPDKVNVPVETTKDITADLNKGAVAGNLGKDPVNSDTIFLTDKKRGKVEKDSGKEKEARETAKRPYYKQKISAKSAAKELSKKSRVSISKKGSKDLTENPSRYRLDLGGPAKGPQHV